MMIVVDSLRSNPHIVVAGGIEEVNLQTGYWPNHGWNHTLDIFTHPKVPRYTAAALNDFMYNLVPELRPTQSDQFDDRGNGLNLGKLYYDDTLGSGVRAATVRLREDASIVRRGLVQKEWSIDLPLEISQRTWVRIYPDEGHLADAALEGRNMYFIPKNELGKSARGRVVLGTLNAPIFGQIIDQSSRG